MKSCLIDSVNKIIELEWWFTFSFVYNFIPVMNIWQITLTDKIKNDPGIMDPKGVLLLVTEEPCKSYHFKDR